MSVAGLPSYCRGHLSHDLESAPVFALEAVHQVLGLTKTAWNDKSLDQRLERTILVLRRWKKLP